MTEELDNQDVSEQVGQEPPKKRGRPKKIENDKFSEGVAQVIAEKLLQDIPAKSLQVEELEAKVKRQADTIAEMKKPKGIASVINTDGTIKRPDEAYREVMPSALSKEKPEDLDIAERNAIERELRKYIKRSGGYRKNLSAELEQRCEKLMKVIGRKKLEWDTSISLPGFGEGHRNLK